MHFAFVVQPLYGHVNPTLPLVEELVRRGHRVSFATGHELVPLVERAGAEGVGLPTKMPEMPSSRDDFTTERFAEIARGITQDARDYFPMLNEHFERDRPDAVCYDWLTFTGQMLVDTIGVPGISLIPIFAANENYSMTAELIGDVPADIAAVMDQIEQERAAFAADHGVTASLDTLNGKHVAALNLVFMPREFQLSEHTFDDRFRFLGPMLPSGETHDDWTPQHTDRPVLYISMGTLFNRDESFYKLCFEAFGDSRWQVAMSIGQRTAVSDLGDIPANFDVRQRFPQLSVLRQADAHISHAGMNSVMESLAHGVPMVALPQMAEQVGNASQSQELGLAYRLDPDDLTPERLRDAVERIVADGKVHTNLDAMRRVISNCGGAIAGADAIEAHVARAGMSAPAVLPATDPERQCAL
ncbi:macrolide family glycosyltransferase [Streptomyces noursei]